MSFQTEQLINGGASFKTGALGQCQICQCRAELGAYEDGRSICEECFEAMSAGKQRNIDAGKCIPLPGFSAVGFEKETEAAKLQVGLQVGWDSISAGERLRYIEVIREKATTEVIKQVISALVSEGTLTHDFHKIIQNERWFSVLDLRKIALRVSPNFEKSPRGPDKKVRAKRRKTWTQLPIQTPQTQQHLQRMAEVAE